MTKKNDMGNFSENLKREVGKNTGKWISNKVFGNGHSTPNRIKVQTERSVEIKEERKAKSAEFRRDLLNKVIDSGSSTQNNEASKIEKEQLNKLLNKKEQLIAKPIPSDKEELFNFSNYLVTEMKSNGWSSSSSDSQKNSISDICLTKLEQCIAKYIQLSEPTQVEYFEKILKTLKRKKFIQKYLPIVILVIGLAILGGLYGLGIIKN